MDAFVAHAVGDLQPSPVWILKPPLSARGENIRFIRHPHIAMQDPSLRRWVRKHKPLAQRYVNNPLLLQGYKCSLRVYFCITSLNPLCVYVYDEGLVRICSTPYIPFSDSPLTASENRGGTLRIDRFLHLDSIDINEKRTDQFSQQCPQLPGMEGLRMLITGWISHLEQQHPQLGDVSQRIWHGIFKAVFVASLAGQAAMLKGQNVIEAYRGNLGWVFYGCDILFDDQFHAWLLEINAYPSLSPHTRLEEPVKVGVIEGISQLLDFTGTDHESVNALLRRRFPQLRLLQKALACHADHLPQNDRDSALLDRFLPHASLISKLTKYDLRLIIELELQMRRAPHFIPLLSNPIMASFVDILPPDRTLLFYLWFSSHLSLEDFEVVHDLNCKCGTLV